MNSEKEKFYCPECGEELSCEYIYETGDTWCICDFCGWEGSYKDAAGEDETDCSMS